MKLVSKVHEFKCANNNKPAQRLRIINDLSSENSAKKKKRKKRK